MGERGQIPIQLVFKLFFLYSVFISYSSNANPTISFIDQIKTHLKAKRNMKKARVIDVLFH